MPLGIQGPTPRGDAPAPDNAYPAGTDVKNEEDEEVNKFSGKNIREAHDYPTDVSTLKNCSLRGDNSGDEDDGE